MSRHILTVVALLIGLISISSSAQDNLVPPERIAFESAVNSWIRFRQTGDEGDVDVQWAKSLKMLAESNSPLADVLLSQLGLFGIDGALAEEFSCAASKRSNRLSIQLRRQLKNFESTNTCVQIASRSGLAKRDFCKSKAEFARLVSTYRKLPLKDEAGACSY